MATIQWQKAEKSGAPKASTPQKSSEGSNTWFGVSMALIGIIAGYFIGMNM